MGVPYYRLAIESISRFAERDEWLDRLQSVTGEHLDRTLNAFAVAVDDLPDVLGGAGFLQLTGFVLEDFLSREFEPGAANVVQDYLTRRGWRESGPGKQYLQALRHSVVSLYEVTGTVPGSHFLAKDLVRGGAPVAVFDKLGSQNLVKWDRIAARLLPVGGHMCMAGGVLPIPFEDAGRLLQFWGEMRAKAWDGLPGLGISPVDGQDLVNSGTVADSFLPGAAPLFSAVWLSGILRRQSSAARPRLVNAEGDEIAFSTTRFPLLDAGLAGEIERQLGRLRMVYREDEPEPAWTWFAKGLPKLAVPSHGGRELSLFTKDAKQRLVLGSIRLEPGALILETNSARRAERGRAMLAAAVGHLVGTPVTDVKSVDEVREENAGQKSKHPASAPDFAPAETAAILGEFLTQHYREVLSLPLPVLDGKSPRQAARSKAGRQRVAEWLKFLENQSARNPKSTGGEDFDFGWMWEELKLTELRQ